MRLKKEKLIKLQRILSDKLTGLFSWIIGRGKDPEKMCLFVKSCYRRVSILYICINYIPLYYVHCTPYTYI